MLWFRDISWFSIVSLHVLHICLSFDIRIIKSRRNEWERTKDLEYGTVKTVYPLVQVFCMEDILFTLRINRFRFIPLVPYERLQ